MRAIDLARGVSHKFGIELVRYPGTLPRARLVRMLHLHDISLVLDVGANTGQYAHTLREFGFEGNIVSFEPMRGEFNVLEAAANGDERWRAINCGLGDQAGETLINVAVNSISSSIRPMAGHAAVAPGSAYAGTETIRIQRLDDVFDELVNGSDRVFLKIDTQGYEREVLRGGLNTIHRIAGLQMEMSFVPLYEGQMLLPEALRLATEEFGMVLEGVEPGFVHVDGRMFQMDGIFFRP